ncbi:MAG: hypothetical protein ACRC28_14710 [Clostridium sp.]|uniref:hypothetical protein n=1 Tax=Clostridium sp. TaxID=1506 RepID=UPI003F409BD9
MIECEICGRYFHVDEIQECSECGVEVCGRCFEEHIKRCIDFREDHEYEQCDYTDRCPGCDEKLEMDIGYEKIFLMCEDCGFRMDVTKEFRR